MPLKLLHFWQAHLTRVCSASKRVFAVTSSYSNFLTSTMVVLFHPSCENFKPFLKESWQHILWFSTLPRYLRFPVKKLVFAFFNLLSLTITCGGVCLCDIFVRRGFKSFGTFWYTLVEHAWTFHMYFNVASNFYHDNLNILRKRYCVNIFLLSPTVLTDILMEFV